jgi:hypothetical protein
MRRCINSVLLQGWDHGPCQVHDGGRAPFWEKTHVEDGANFCEFGFNDIAKSDPVLPLLGLAYTCVQNLVKIGSFCEFDLLSQWPWPWANPTLSGTPGVGAHVWAKFRDDLVVFVKVHLWPQWPWPLPNLTPQCSGRVRLHVCAKFGEGRAIFVKLTFDLNDLCRIWPLSGTPWRRSVSRCRRRRRTNKHTYKLISNSSMINPVRTYVWFDYGLKATFPPESRICSMNVERLHAWC